MTYSDCPKIMLQSIMYLQAIVRVGNINNYYCKTMLHYFLIITPYFIFNDMLLLVYFIINIL